MLHGLEITLRMMDDGRWTMDDGKKHRLPFVVILNA